LEGGRIVSDANADVRQGHEHRHEWKPQGQSGYERDPWIRWAPTTGPRVLGSFSGLASTCR
jgi:hypothetical protein